MVKIFTGSPPATCETADSGTLLVTLTLSATAFPTATDSGTGYATASASTITSGTAGNTGTAGYFRAYPHPASTTNATIQGTVGTSAADLIISSTTINSGDTVSCSSWVVNLPDGSGAD